MIDIYPPLSGSFVLTFDAGAESYFAVYVRGTKIGDVELVPGETYMIIVSCSIGGFTNTSLWLDNVVVTESQTITKVSLSDDVSLNNAISDPTVFYSDIRELIFLNTPPADIHSLEHWIHGDATSAVDIRKVPDWGYRPDDFDASTDDVEVDDYNIIPSNYKIHDGSEWRTVGISRFFGKAIDLGGNRIDNLGDPSRYDQAATLGSVVTVNDALRSEVSKDIAQLNKSVQELKEALEGTETGGGAEKSPNKDNGYGVGDIRQSLFTETVFKAGLEPSEAKTWVLADGRDVGGTEYESLSGDSNVPDLRGAYLRMAGRNEALTDRLGEPWNGGSIGTAQQYLTAEPVSKFVTNSAGNYKATITTSSAGQSYVISSEEGLEGAHTHETQSLGDHTHIVSGGDKETRPPTYTVNYFIKVDK